MNNFEYYNPVRIKFGAGALDDLKGLIPKNRRILVIMGEGSIKKNGIYDRVVASLEGVTYFEFWGITPNPEYEDCLKAIELAKAEKVDFLLSVGGGSVLDATKFIAAALKADCNPWDIVEKGVALKDAMPIGCVLTIPATGSEVNGNSVVSRRETGQKMAFSSPLVMPQFSILDPETTLSLSKRQTANGIIDSFVHVMEQYLTYDVNTPLQDRQAEAILQTLVEVGPIVQTNPDDIDARSNIMWCASNALNNLINCGTVQDWSSHIIGHELTALHGLDHAQTLAIVLPAIMEYMREHKGDKICQYAKRVWNIEESSKDDTIDACIEKTKAFFEYTGCPTRLSAYDITVESCLVIAETLKDRGMVIGEHNNIGPNGIKAILQLCK